MLNNPNWKPADIKLEPWQEMLFEAADLLETQGWVRGCYHTASGQHCAIGALSAIKTKKMWLSYEDSRDACRHAIRELAKKINSLEGGVDDESRIVNWNDRKGRKAEEVIGTMRRVANRD